MIAGIWTRQMVALFLWAALLPIALFWALEAGAEGLLRLAVVLLVIVVWQLVFMLARAQPPSLSGLITALAIAMLAPEETGMFRLILGTGFGIVMGELVFGGWGRNVVNPATVAVSFLGFGFPGLPWPEIALPVAWAAIPAAVIGMATGVMPAGVIVSACLVAAGAVWAGGLDPALLPGAGVVLVLLVADPATSAVTAAGRWLQGVAFALLVVLFANGWTGAATVELAVAAALLASLAASLFDDIALSLWQAERRRRHGRS